MSRIRLITLFIALLLIGIPISAQEATPEATPEPASDATCTPITIEPGATEYTLSMGDDERRYVLYVPESDDPAGRVPLVISLHGFSDNPLNQAEISEWNALADENGFLVAYPGGTGFPSRWNTDDSDFGGFIQPADDVGFLSRLIDRLVDEMCIDPARVYMNGFSNGGGMTDRFACDAADKVAAVGLVAGAYNMPDFVCDPARPMPLVAFHGTDDPVVPYNGGQSGPFTLPAIDDWLADWVERNGCTDDPEPLDAEGAVVGTAYTGCDDDVAVHFYLVGGYGHTWPGGGRFFEAMISPDIDASATMWEFFTAYTLPD